MPIGKEKSVFYYYKQFRAKEFMQNHDDDESMSLLPEARSLYMCHFVQPIKEDFIMKYFNKTQIKKVEIGQYRNKSTNARKGKRRTIYFAIIVFRNEDYMQSLLSTPQALQDRVNKIAGRQLRSFNQGIFDEDGASSDSDDDEERKALRARKRTHREMMEDGGFTVVDRGGNFMSSKKQKTKDEHETNVVHGISHEEAQRIYKEQLRRGSHIVGMTEEEIKAERERIFKEDRESEALQGLNLEQFRNIPKVPKGKGTTIYAFEQRE